MTQGQREIVRATADRHVVIEKRDGDWWHVEVIFKRGREWDSKVIGFTTAEVKRLAYLTREEEE